MDIGREEAAVKRRTIQAETRLITPMDAELLLSSNDLNRKPKKDAIDRYAAMMTAGQWLLSGEPIIVGEDGVLVDGQHRLMAVVKSGLPQEFLLVRNVTTAARVVVDSGVARSVGDVMSMRGVANANAVSSAARLVMAYEAGRVTEASYKPSRADVISRYEQTAAVFDEAVRVGYTVRVGSRLNLTAVATFYVLLQGAPGAADYLDKLAHGEGLHAYDAAHSVRGWSVATTRGRSSLVDLSVILRGYPYHRDGKQLRRVYAYWRGGPTQFPYLESTTNNNPQTKDN